MAFGFKKVERHIEDLAAKRRGRKMYRYGIELLGTKYEERLNFKLTGLETGIDEVETSVENMWAVLNLLLKAYKRKAETRPRVLVLPMSRLFPATASSMYMTPDELGEAKNLAQVMHSIGGVSKKLGIRCVLYCDDVEFQDYDREPPEFGHDLIAGLSYLSRLLGHDPRAVSANGVAIAHTLCEDIGVDAFYGLPNNVYAVCDHSIKLDDYVRRSKEVGKPMAFEMDSCRMTGSDIKSHFDNRGFTFPAPLFIRQVPKSKMQEHAIKALKLLSYGDVWFAT